MRNHQSRREGDTTPKLLDYHEKASASPVFAGVANPYRFELLEHRR